MKVKENGHLARYLSFDKALRIIEDSCIRLPKVELDLTKAADLVLVEDVSAEVDSPPADVSAMDGYAVRSADLARAGEGNPVALQIVGKATAGKSWPAPVMPGMAIGITTGAPLPADTDTVVPEEMCREPGEGRVEVVEDLESGAFIRRQGADTRSGAVLAERGRVLSPGLLGHLAAAGIARVRIVRPPTISLIAVGDEIVKYGETRGPRQIFASNLVNLSAWSEKFGVAYNAQIVNDDVAEIRDAVDEAVSRADVIITIGGAWGSHRDLVLPVLDSLGWRRLFRRVRMAPGKGSAFGELRSKSVFCLPGGPPSCEMVFLQLVLPAIFRLAGKSSTPLPVIPARLTESVTGRYIDWTSFHHATLSRSNGHIVATAHRPSSRLESMSLAECLIRIPEGTRTIEAGEIVDVQILNWAL